MEARAAAPPKLPTRMNGAIGRKQGTQVDGVRAAVAAAPLRARCVFDAQPLHQSTQQRLERRRRSTRGDDCPPPAGDHRIGFGAKMFRHASIDARETADSLCRRQSREFRIARPRLQGRQGENPRDQSAFLQEALCRFEPDQIVDEPRCLSRRLLYAGRLGSSQIEAAAGAVMLRKECVLVEGREALAARWATIQQTSAMMPAGHNAGAPPLLSKIGRLILGEADRTKLQPSGSLFVGVGRRQRMMERQKQRSPLLGADRHGGDSAAVDAGLIMQVAQHGSRRGEIEPRRPCAGADAEAFPEVARRQAMSESTAMQCARQQLMVRGNHLQWS